MLATAPDQTALAAAERTLDARAATQQRSAPPRTPIAARQIGTRIEVFANLGSLAEAQARGGARRRGLRPAAHRVPVPRPRGAAGRGRAGRASTRRIATALDGRPLVIRLLDIGGDKPSPICRCRRRRIPALGVRGVRTSLRRPDLLRSQLRAILRVQPAGQCRVMLPMVTGAAEMRAVRAVLDEVAARARRHRPLAARRHDRNARGGYDRRPASRARSTSCRSAPTTSPNTRWPWTAATPSSRRASTGCIPRCCG